MVNRSIQATIWEVSDETWEVVEAVLAEHYPRRHADRCRVDLRPVLNGIIFRLRTGCQWNKLPKEFGDDSTVHRHFQNWCKLGIFEIIWATLVKDCDELGGVDWEWQSADGSLGKARFGGIKWARTRRIAANAA